MKQRKLIPLTLEQHQQILYEILYMVDDFCREYDIKYFLVGGSLLGAIRHNGIIPWDDDIDIAMIRSEHDRFISLFEKNTPEGYHLWRLGQKDYFYPYCKISKEGTLAPECQERGIPKDCMGINIDLFVYDGCPGNHSEAVAYFNKLHRKIGEFAKWYTWQNFHRNPFHFNHNWNVLKWRMLFHTKYVKTLLDSCRTYKVQDTDFTANIIWGIYGDGEVRPSEELRHTIQHPFGDRAVPIPIGYHDYLKGIYGDYMKLPPITNQQPHHTFGGVYIIANS